MRYVFILLTLLILSDSFSFVFAQSMYKFKGKSTNISPLRPNSLLKKSTPNSFLKKPKIISKNNQNTNYQNIKFPPKIRFRHLTGSYTTDSQEATISTSSIIWDGVGIGQTVFKYKTSISGKTVELENTSMDFSYTYGDEYTLMLGGSSISQWRINRNNK